MAYRLLGRFRGRKGRNFHFARWCVMSDIYTFNSWHIRETILKALRDYVERGVPLGDFLRCVVSNDFVEACARADQGNLENLPAFAAWLYNECPRDAWGSDDRYVGWVGKHAKVHRVAEEQKP